jgi:hypothetical protein
VRRSFTEEVERGREVRGELASLPGQPWGAFRLRSPFDGSHLVVLMAGVEAWENEGGPPPAWEHVSASLATRCPTWAEMAWVKGLFWEDEEQVVQFHPPRSAYVNRHPNCLHLWRCPGHEPALPPLECV